ncbi:MAG TPA: hypothetical protein VLJ21_02445 [Candidatus Binatia bacterium]|nr:hypothetical protein [Candidatus Binatia bacterium]
MKKTEYLDPIRGEEFVPILEDLVKSAEAFVFKQFKALAEEIFMLPRDYDAIGQLLAQGYHREARRKNFRAVKAYAAAQDYMTDRRIAMTPYWGRFLA